MPIRWAKSCSSSSELSLTMWHHRRPRNHQRGSSMSTATTRVCPRLALSSVAGARETGVISDEAELQTAWTASVGAGTASAAALAEVLARHREPHRRYHGVRHVTWVVRHVAELAQEVPLCDGGAVVAAAFFHDAVYDPRAADNEAQSARLAERVLGELGWAA